MFTQCAGQQQNYTLSSDGGFSARGQSGPDAEKRRRHADGWKPFASPGGEFTVTKYSTLGMISQLQNNLTVTENGKDAGVLSLTYSGEDREQITRHS